MYVYFMFEYDGTMQNCGNLHECQKFEKESFQYFTQIKQNDVQLYHKTIH